MINVLLSLMLIGSFLVAIPLHECAHALMASWLGDPTPRAEGRQTLRLREHIDPVGTLLCVILAFQPISIGSFPIGFGWGKPVKPDPWKMHIGANKGVLAVACAGPIFNLLIGLLFAFLAGVLWPFVNNNEWLIRLMQLLIVFASVNICIMLVNLIPLYPLDGYQILYTLLPSKQAVQFSRSATYGPFIILALFFLLPFIGNLARIDFPLFHLAYYIWEGSVLLIARMFGGNLATVVTFYAH